MGISNDGDVLFCAKDFLVFYLHPDDISVYLYQQEGNTEKGTAMEVKDYYGNDVNFEAAANLMDDELREELHMELAPCSEQEFFDAYAEAHMKKFNEEFAPYYNLAW